ncbi:class I SAM-dependent methyltransferase [Flagellimonas pacifica]|uniref:Methyltransferase domain-containing protein n=1 Tax=Flagellimonas pacifica TaxID=1247520 RepID=A0A285MRV2_9FLAO|nr:class I SAM-dependent methyltransferase [Allomuricauda parva]SNY99919.1 Methyltransferase domain-containing protein [Allomuricauda parva]
MKSIFYNLIILFFSVSGIHAQYTEEDWKDRDTWMKTADLLNFSGIKEGDKVADIGCHEGYLSMHLSKRVLENGRVYAVDVREDRLKTLRENANSRNRKNIITILGDYDNPKLPERELDLIFIIDTYHEMESYEKILQHVKKSLKPNGKVVILEKLKTHVKGKSREVQISAHSLGPEYVRKELKQAGFTIISEIEDHGKWERESSKQMWVILAQKQK